MKKLIPAIIAAALLSGCATQNDAVALSIESAISRSKSTRFPFASSLPSIA